MTRILLLCSHNSARSQIAEALARSLVREGVEVASAGTVATAVNPVALQVLRERGIDTRALWSKTIEQLDGTFDYVITLCDEADRECPHVRARLERLHWPFPDPSKVQGDPQAIHQAFSQTLVALEQRLRQWLREKKLLRDDA